jgi:(+)-pinoresinol hydroxylase
MALQRKYKGSLPAILNLRSDMDADHVKSVVRQGISFMPTFRKTEISDAELDHLAAYVIHQSETGKVATANPASGEPK